MNETCGNMEINGDVVTMKTSLRLMKTLVATGIYGVILYALLEDGFPFRTFTLPYLIVFLIATAIWGWYVSRQKTTTTFVPGEKTVYRRNLIRTTHTLPFSEIAGLTRVLDADGDVFYKIALKKDPLGAGLRVTDNYRDGDAEYEFFKSKVLGTAEAMIEADAPEREDKANTPATLPETPLRYRKTGPLYERRVWKGPATAISLGAAVVLIGAQTGRGPLALLGVAVMLFSLVSLNYTALDTANRKIIIGRAFGFWKKSYAMERFVGINLKRSYTNGFYTGTSTNLEFADPHASVMMSHNFITRGLDVLVDETTAIITATMNDRQADGKNQE